MEMLPIVGKLKDHGIAKIIAEFDGQGDSGEVHDITFYDINHNYIDFDVCNILEDYIYKLIEECVNDYGGDWVNNDGGYGNVNIDLKNKTVEIDYNQRTIDEYAWSSSIFDD